MDQSDLFNNVWQRKEKPNDSKVIEKYFRLKPPKIFESIIISQGHGECGAKYFARSLSSRAHTQWSRDKDR